MFYMACLKNVRNMVLISKSELATADHETCTFKMCWTSYISDVSLVQGCREKCQKFASICNIIHSFYFSLQLELFHERFLLLWFHLELLAAAEHLGGLCWKIKALPGSWNISNKNCDLSYYVNCFALQCLCKYVIIMAQLYIYKRSTAFEDGYSKSLLSANCKKS